MLSEMLALKLEYCAKINVLTVRAIKRGDQISTMEFEENVMTSRFLNGYSKINDAAKAEVDAALAAAEKIYQ
jgi:predicted methyltransferase